MRCRSWIKSGLRTLAFSTCSIPFLRYNVLELRPISEKKENMDARRSHKHKKQLEKAACIKNVVHSCKAVLQWAVFFLPLLPLCSYWIKKCIIVWGI